MFAAPFTTQRRPTLRPITLGWSQYVTLGAGLCAVAVVVTILFGYEIADFFERREVLAYERDFGFEIGLLRHDAANGGTWGIVRVVPGGRMDRAGLQSGDVFVGPHGDGFGHLHWALTEAASGRTACILVSNVADTPVGRFTSREVCLQGITGK